MGITPGTARLTQQLGHKSWISGSAVEVQEAEDDLEWLGEGEEEQVQEELQPTEANEMDEPEEEWDVAADELGEWDDLKEDIHDDEVNDSNAQDYEDGEADEYLLEELTPQVSTSQLTRKKVQPLVAKSEKAAEIGKVKWEQPKMAFTPKKVNPEEPRDEFEIFREAKRAESGLRDASCRAICRIKHGVRQLGAQSDGRPFVPSDWDEVFKPKLGSYKKFLMSRPDQFRIVDGGGPGFYTIDIVLNEVVVAPSWADLMWAKGFGQGKGKGKGKGKFAGGKFGGKPEGKVSGQHGWGLQDDSLPAGKRALVAKAISDIKKRLQEKGALSTFKSVIPANWEAQYKPSLGSFEEFVRSHPDHFWVAKEPLGGYTIELASDHDGYQPQTAAAKLIANVAREQLDEEEAALGLGEEFGGEDEDPEVDDGIEEDEDVKEEDVLLDDSQANTTDFLLAQMGTDETYNEIDVDSEMGSASFMVVKPAKHGSYIRSLLSGGPSSVKHEAPERELESNRKRTRLVDLGQS